MSKIEIRYRRDAPVPFEDFVELYHASTLGERRPVAHLDVMRQMMENANLTMTAWSGERLVGLARSLTDFGYVAYLADLAVHRDHQRRGIGRALVQATREALGEHAMIVLLAAPGAHEYYRRIGFAYHERAWVLAAGQPLR